MSVITPDYTIDENSVIVSPLSLRELKHLAQGKDHLLHLAVQVDQDSYLDAYSAYGWAGAGESDHYQLVHDLLFDESVPGVHEINAGLIITDVVAGSHDLLVTYSVNLRSLESRGYDLLHGL